MRNWPAARERVPSHDTTYGDRKNAMSPTQIMRNAPPKLTPSVMHIGGRDGTRIAHWAYFLLHICCRFARAAKR
jgi:hypothetical protein